MRVSDIRLLYRYNTWANRRILARAEEVTAEQLTAPAPFPSGSLLGTLAHTLGAEWLWLRRWRGDPVGALLPALDEPEFNALRVLWTEEERRQEAFIAGLAERDLDRIVSYRTLAGREDAQPLWALMVHVVNHGTQHRSEAAAMLTGYGRSPGDLDLSVFLRQEE
jgi:uncharacterized damage-inducible protein DinB